MHPQLVDELINQKTSLGKHQFSQIVTKTLLNKKLWVNVLMKQNVTWAHDVRTINPDKVISELMPLVRLGMAIEGPHIQELEELAIKMIREDFDMDEDVVEIRAKLTLILA
jgi:hypothetical protein